MRVRVYVRAPVAPAASLTQRCSSPYASIAAAAVAILVLLLAFSAMSRSDDPAGTLLPIAIAFTHGTDGHPTPSPSISSSPSVTPSYTSSPSHSASPSPSPEACIPFGGSTCVPASRWQSVQDHADCLREGQWVETDQLQLMWERTSHSDSRCFDPPFSKKAHPAFYYAWTPPQRCPLPAFNSTEFCTALAGRDILIVGDSMNFMFHDVACTSLCDEKTQDHNQWAECPRHPICVKEAAATRNSSHRIRPASLQYIRNDYVNLVNDGRKGRNEKPWRGHVTPNTLLVMNRGAHVTATSAFATEVNDTLRWLAQNVRGAGVVWRATPHGHPEGDEPNSAALLPLRALPTYPPGNKYHDSYGWSSFEVTNAMARQLIAEVSATYGVGYVFVDTDASTGLRPDHHRDGLHYCIPGPVDHWLQLLQAVLQAAAKVAAA